MASVHDVAAYILSKKSPITALKLQKLVYYSQAWSLVWDQDELFPEEFLAFANGPVVYELWNQYRSQFNILNSTCGSPEMLTPVQRETIDVILDSYGNLSASQLSLLTHSEDPWKIARNGIADLEPSSEVITKTSMAEYYSQVQNSRAATGIDEVNWPSDTLSIEE